MPTKIKWRGSDWKSAREKAKQRDNYRCRDCGKKEDKKNRIYLQVHHITPYSETKDNSLPNLLTLCSSCHTKLEYSLGRIPIGKYTDAKHRKHYPKSPEGMISFKNKMSDREVSTETRHKQSEGAKRMWERRHLAQQAP